jgi:hypothetical protein
MLAHFACARFRLVLEAVDGLRLNAFAGATLRGGFGHVFKQTVCIWPPADCPRCLLRHSCSYPYIFETSPPPGAEKLRNLDQVPRPFVIEPPQGERLFEPGERFEFRLVLIGRAIDYLPYFVFTFQRLGEEGLGRDLGQYRLLEIHAETPAGSRAIFDSAAGVLDCAFDRMNFTGLPPPRESRLRIHFQTPARIKSDGAMRTELTFQDLIRALLRRLSSLQYFHCGRELEIDFRGLIEQPASPAANTSASRWAACSATWTSRPRTRSFGSRFGRS